MGHLSCSLEVNSAEGYVECRGSGQEVSEGGNIGSWARKCWYNNLVKDIWLWAEEIAQWLRALVLLQWNWFGPQFPTGGSQHPVALLGQLLDQAHMVYIHMCSKTFMHIKIKIKKPKTIFIVWLFYIGIYCILIKLTPYCHPVSLLVPKPPFCFLNLWDHLELPICAWV